LAAIKVAELRKVKHKSEITIADLREQINNFEEIIKAKSSELARKDHAIKVLNSNAFMDEIALKQKDVEIAALRTRLLKVDKHGGQGDAVDLEQGKKRLNSTILDLRRVKAELMNEIEALEVKKEQLEFE
jgi:hypothetical protein